MEKLHALLRRQWQRIFGRDKLVPEDWRPFLQTVSETYAEFDTGRVMVERALGVEFGRTSRRQRRTPRRPAGSPGLALSCSR